MIVIEPRVCLQVRDGLVDRSDFTLGDRAEELAW
jgi:hypothetical protein